MRAGPAVLLAVVAGGCNEPDTGFVWEIDLTTNTDGCTEDAEPYQETFDYVLNFDGAFVNVAIDVQGEGPITFATGSIQGCILEYTSIPWEEQRGAHRVRYQIEGSARWRQGGDFTCNLEPGIDWLGGETFRVLYSDDPEVPNGCTYLLDAEGVYLGEL